MSAASPLLPTVTLLSAGVIGLAIARFAHISPIVGFFVLGAIIGPQALGLIDNHTPTLHFLGELGVCFLLFDIGLHLSLAELRRGWRGFLLSGVLQFAIATAALAGVLRLIGVGWGGALALGAIFSLSSTALVLKILADEQEESSPIGKRATEILVFQDIVAILLLVILGGDLSQGITVAALAAPLGKMLLAAAFVIILGKIALKPLFRLLIALKSDEVITAFALLLVFLASWGTESLGLSLALGAFLGGLALSESSYSYLVRGEVAPFRALLLSLFFLSVGINLDVRGMFDNIALLIVLLALFAAVKIAANLIAFRLAGSERGLSTLLAFMLAQGSEFAFVLLALASSSGLIDAQLLNLSILLVGLSLAITPALASVGCLFSRSVCKVSREDDPANSEEREVILVRIDDFGRQLATFLEREKIPYRAHDLDLERLAYAKSRGFNVYYSDLNRPRTLARVSMGKALAVVSLVEEDAILFPLIEGIKKISPNLPLIAATEEPKRLDLLATLGVENAFIKRDESAVAMLQLLMESLGYAATRIEEAVQRALTSLEPEEMFPRISESPPLAAEAAPAGMVIQ